MRGLYNPGRTVLGLTFALLFCVSAYGSVWADEDLEEAVKGLVNAFLLKQQLKQGDKRFNRGDYQGALAEYQQALNTANVAPVHVRIGHCYVGLNKLPEATNEYQQALQLDRNAHSAYAGLGRVALLQKDYPRAAEQFQQALRLASKADYHDGLGAVCYEQGQFAEALPHYERAVKLSPKSPLFHTHLASALCMNQQPDRALAELEQALQLDPQFAPAYLWQGVTCHQLGRVQEATEALEQYLQLNPNAPADDLGRTLLAQIQGKEREGGGGLIIAGGSGGQSQEGRGGKGREEGGLIIVGDSGGQAYTPIPSRPSPYGRPAAVRAAVERARTRDEGRGTRDEGRGVGTEEPIAGGTMKLYCRDFWQVADRTDNSLMLVAQEVQDFAVKVEWQEGGFPASREEQTRERLAWLGARFPGVERLPEGEVAGGPAQRFAWVEVAENERRESLQWQWVRGGALLRLTVTAPPPVWEQHGEQVFALFVPPSPGGTGDAERGTRDGGEGQSSSFPLQIEGSTGGGS